MSISGKWQQLADHLMSKGDDEIVLTDDEIQNIVGSTDNTRPYDIYFPSDPRYSIHQRADDAEYNVLVDNQNDQVKIFTKK